MSIQIKKQQYLILSLVVGVVVVVLVVLAFWGKKSTPSKVDEKVHYTKHSLASPISSSTSEAHWIEKTQNAWRAEQEKSKQFDKHIKTLSEEEGKQQKLIKSQQDEISDVKSQLTELRQQLSRMDAIRNSQADEPSKKFQQQNTGLPRAGEELPNAMMEMDPGFIQYSAKLSKSTKPRIKTPDNYVFSNTFAKAVVLQGADASAGVLSQANPDIMIFQLIDDGVMPNRHKSHLNGCIVSASVIGDISSERGKFRTERISCIHPDGTSLDTQVTGIVSDSKNGIRGRAVWRDQPMVKKAFWGSFWESMGNIGQQYSNDYSVSALGSVATIQPTKIPLAAVSSGGSGAAKMYAQYNIKRAEMYHPIIELSANTIVDVTFLKGFWLDGGTDDQAPENPSQITQAQAGYPATSASAEEKEAQQFFYKNHSF